jgi:hypothetical protein
VRPQPGHCPYGRILEYSNGIVIYVKICKVFGRY